MLPRQTKPRAGVDCDERRCPTCLTVLVLPADGQIPRHYWPTRKGDLERRRCPAGELHATPPKGRRVVVKSKIVLPVGLSAYEAQMILSAALRERAQELFVINLEVDEA